MTSKVEKEFEEFESKNLWPQIYQKIKNEASLKSINEKLSVGEARKPENRSKNRYRDVSPYDHSRVVLQKVPEGDSDYINASVIQVPESNRTYILSQGPLEHTVPQFWQMIWEQNTKAIIMLNRVIEKGTLKCHQYWPLGEDEETEEMIFYETGLKVTLLEEQAYPHYIVRTLDLEDIHTKEVREVYHFHYITWPDFGIPSSPISFLSFLEAVRLKGVLDPEVGPAVIHCSAGIGRSGTFCLVDSALVLVEKAGSLEGLDVQSLLISMRSYRMGLIQTFDQLKFSYMAIIAGARKILALKRSQENIDDINSDKSDEASEEETVPPTPPQRVESLSPNSRGKVPPPPPPRSYPDGEPPNKLFKPDVTEVPQKPPRSYEITDASPPTEDSKNEEVSPPPPQKTEDDEKRNIEETGTDSKGMNHIEQNYQQHNESDSENKNYNKEPSREAAEDWNKEKNGGDGEMKGGDQKQETENSVPRTPSEVELRQRRKEDRIKRQEKTREMISQMKEKQRSNEIWKKRKSYIKPIAIGLSILIGTYILYKLVY